MIAVDTSILVHAHRADSPWHAAAAAAIQQLAETARWAIPWACVHEFYSVVTHPPVFRPPSTTVQALTQIDLWCASPGLVLIGETEQHLTALRDVVSAGKLTGPAIHDARIAAVCLQHGVQELWSADRDFARMRSLRVRNPLIPGHAREPRARYAVGAPQRRSPAWAAGAARR